MQRFFDLIRLKSLRLINKICGITSLTFSVDEYVFYHPLEGSEMSIIKRTFRKLKLLLKI